MKIGLDAGHGYNTAGKRTPDDIREWSLNNSVCNYITEYLKGYADILRLDDTSGKTDIERSTRRNKALNNGCDLLLSIHHNALHDGYFSNVTGVETFTHPKYPNAKATEISKLLANKMSEQTGLKNRGAKTNNLEVIATSKIPAILCEGGFMDGENDSYYIRTNEGQRAYAKAVVDVIKSYYGLAESGSGTSTEENKPEPAPTGTTATIQDTLNQKYNLSISVDNKYGVETKKALVKALQIELNIQFENKLDVDGVFGLKTKAVCINVKIGAEGNITWLIQAMLYCKNYNPNGLDGIFGTGMKSCVKQFQKDNSLSADGIVGKNTFNLLFI